ncbi:hypothetical protein JCM3770_000259 [Rhodotorula araucariae]
MSRQSDFLTFTYPPSSSSSSLPSTTSALPPAFSLLLTDTLDAPATFLLVQLVARALRPLQAGPGRRIEPRRRVLVVGVRERDEYWAGVLKKNGIQLVTETASGRFTFVDASSPSLSLPALFASLCTVLSPSSPDGPANSEPSQSAPSQSPAGEDTPGPLVIIDDLSALLWVGREPRDVARWWHGVRALVDEHAASLVTLLHADTLSPSPAMHAPAPAHSPYASPEDQYLFRQVLQASDIWGEVVGLGNGGTGARGELSLHRGPALLAASATAGGWTADAPRSGARALQYKLDEGAAAWEIKGQMAGRVW